MNLRFDIPSSVDEISQDGKIAKYSIKPLERGYGTTIGNALRRVLLASMPGAAIVGVKIEGVDHEFSTMEGVVEDVMGIVLNLKEIIFKVDSNDPDFVTDLELEVNDKEVVTASDFNKVTGIEICNPDHVICHLNKGTNFKMTAQVRLGIGYVSSEENKKFNKVLGHISIDSIFSPVVRVAYHVEKIRGDQDELQIEIETNGAIEAKDALAQASNILIQHFEVIKEISENSGVQNIFEEEEQVDDNKKLDMKIDELDLTSRLYNALKRGGIYTVKQILDLKEEEIRKFRGLGRKSCEELKQKLSALGLELPESTIFNVDFNDENKIEEVYGLDEDLFHEGAESDSDSDEE